MAPALCVGGLLEHACSEGEIEMDVECGHEESCPADVCSSAVRACERESQLDLAGFAAPVLFVLPTWEIDAVMFTSTRTTSQPLPPDRSNLPFAASDRPQLI